MPKTKNPPKTVEDLVSAAQAAEILHRHVRTVHRLVAEGALKPAVKIAGKTGAYLFHRVDVEALKGRDVA